MKKILSLILCLMLNCSLIGCGGSESSDDYPVYITIAGRPYLRIDIENDDYILVDVEYKTQYWFMQHGYGDTMTLLVDSEGKPLLYEGEIPYELHKD